MCNFGYTYSIEAGYSPLLYENDWIETNTERRFSDVTNNNVISVDLKDESALKDEQK